MRRTARLRHPLAGSSAEHAADNRDAQLSAAAKVPFTPTATDAG